MRRNLKALGAIALAFALLTAQTPAPEAALGGYDLDKAMELAGEQIPLYIESYYFFVLDRDVPVADEAHELADTLVRAAGEHEFVGITGPDPERNLRTLEGALNEVGSRKLAGLVLIFIGPAYQESLLAGAVRARGADFRFISYPSVIREAI